MSKDDMIEKDFNFSFNEEPYTMSKDNMIEKIIKRITEKKKTKI